MHSNLHDDPASAWPSFLQAMNNAVWNDSVILFDDVGQNVWEVRSRKPSSACMIHSCLGVTERLGQACSAVHDALVGLHACFAAGSRLACIRGACRNSHWLINACDAHAAIPKLRHTPHLLPNPQP